MSRRGARAPNANRACESVCGHAWHPKSLPYYKEYRDSIRLSCQSAADCVVTITSQDPLLPLGMTRVHKRLVPHHLGNVTSEGASLTDVL